MAEKQTQEEFNKRERFVSNFLIGYHGELLDSVETLKKGNPSSVKSQLCLAFIAADTFSRFYQIITEPKEAESSNKLWEKIKSFFCKRTVNYQNKKRFTDWFNKFVLADSNKIYKENKEKFKDCTVSYVWRLRCSLLHFFSFPELKYGNYVLGSELINSRLKKFVNQLKPEDKKKLNPKYIYYPELMSAIFQSIESQADELVKMFRETPTDYVLSINKCFTILRSEGAETRDFKNILEKI